MMLKANLHLHSREDPQDIHIKYDFFQAVDEAARLGFSVLAFTPHKKYRYEERFGAYAARKNVLVIPGLEAKIEGKEVLLLNCGPEADAIRTFAALRAYKESHPEILVVAPHPYFPAAAALGGKLVEHISLFDAIEWSWYYTKIFDFNRRARQTAEKFKKSFLATSDTHDLSFLGGSYALIEAEKNVASVVAAVKAGNFQNISAPRTWRELAWFFCQHVLGSAAARAMRFFSR